MHRLSRFAFVSLARQSSICWPISALPPTLSAPPLIYKFLTIRSVFNPPFKNWLFLAKLLTERSLGPGYERASHAIELKTKDVGEQCVVNVPFVFIEGTCLPGLLFLIWFCLTVWWMELECLGSRNGRLTVINKLGWPKSKLRSVVVSNQRWLIRASQSIVAWWYL